MSPLPHLFARLLCQSACGLLLMSCETTKPTSGDPYASNYTSDGGYNPYPGQSGYAQSGSYQPPSYTVPPAPTQANPYAFSSSGAAPKPKTPATTASSAPRKPATTAAAKPKSTATATRSRGSSYTVEQGDTLYGIARKKGSTVAKIKAANGLSSDLIRPGQSLKIP